MKIKNKLNFFLGLLLFIGDLYLLYNGIFNELTRTMVGYMLLSHFGAMFFAHEIESEYLYSIPFVPGILLFEGNMSPEWKKKYDWVLHIPPFCLLLFMIVGYFIF